MVNKKIKRIPTENEKKRISNIYKTKIVKDKDTEIKRLTKEIRNKNAYIKELRNFYLGRRKKKWDKEGLK